MIALIVCSILTIINATATMPNNRNTVNIMPCIVGTWDFSAIALNEVIPLLDEQSDGTVSAVDIVEKAVTAVELDLADQYYVGKGGFPNAEGEMELDAAIMDDQCRFGAVMAMPKIPTAISVARTVMDRSPHNCLAGEGALKWALSQKFDVDEKILIDEVKQEWLQWKKDRTIAEDKSSKGDSHDTVGVICLDSQGKLAVGTSTSGWRFKHPGRIGDSPIIGSGLYCDGEVGAAMATGDGEDIMRVCISFMVVELMRSGKSPAEACRMAIERLKKLIMRDSSTGSLQPGMHSTQLVVGVVAMDPFGNVGAASTLDSDNLHRGKPFFPVICWRPNNLSSSKCRDNSNNLFILEASTGGASF